MLLLQQPRPASAATETAAEATTTAQEAGKSAGEAAEDAAGVSQKAAKDATGWRSWLLMRRKLLARSSRMLLTEREDLGTMACPKQGTL